VRPAPRTHSAEERTLVTSTLRWCSPIYVRSGVAAAGHFCRTSSYLSVLSIRDLQRRCDDRSRLKLSPGIFPLSRLCRRRLLPAPLHSSAVRPRSAVTAATRLPDSRNQARSGSPPEQIDTTAFVEPVRTCESACVFLPGIKRCQSTVCKDAFNSDHSCNVFYTFRSVFAIDCTCV